MRELNEREIDQVAGGALNLGFGAAFAVVGGLIDGASYAVRASQQGNFSTGRFATTVATGAVSGFMMGTGASLMHAGYTGAIKGASVLGASVGGAGASLKVASSVSGPGPMGGGSD